MNKGTVFTMCMGLLFNSDGRQNKDSVIGDYIREGRDKLMGTSKRITAAFDDDACYQCGSCCKDMPCQYGEWDEEAHQCKNLVIGNQTDVYTTYKCGIYQSIRKAEMGKKYPMFGGGCYSPLFNPARAHIIACLKRKS